MFKSIANTFKRNHKLEIAMDLNNHEFSAMLVIAFIGLIQDQYHKTAIETVMLDWLDKDIIRPEIYEHYRDERNNTM